MNTKISKKLLTEVRKELNRLFKEMNEAGLVEFESKGWNSGSIIVVGNFHEGYKGTRLQPSEPASFELSHFVDEERKELTPEEFLDIENSFRDDSLTMNHLMQIIDQEAIEALRN